MNGDDEIDELKRKLEKVKLEKELIKEQQELETLKNNDDSIRCPSDEEFTDVPSFEKNTEDLELKVEEEIESENKKNNDFGKIINEEQKEYSKQKRKKTKSSASKFISRFVILLSVIVVAILIFDYLKSLDNTVSNAQGSELIKKALDQESDLLKNLSKELQINDATEFLLKVKRINNPIQKEEIKFSKMALNQEDTTEIGEKIAMLSKNAIKDLEKIDTSKLKGSEEYISSMIALLETNIKVAEEEENETVLKLERAIENNNEELIQTLLVQVQKESQIAQNEMMEKRMRFKKAQYDFGDANNIKIYRDKESEEYFKQLEKIDEFNENFNNDLTETILSDSGFEEAIDAVVARGEAKNAVEFNNALSGIAESYILKMVIFVQNQTSDKRDEYLKDCNDAVEEAINKLNSIKPYKDGEAFLGAIKKRAEFHKGVFKNTFVEMNKITSKKNMSLADAVSLENLVKEIGTNEKKLDTEALQAQKNFMATHNINYDSVRDSTLKKKFDAETPKALENLNKDLEILKGILREEE